MIEIKHRYTGAVLFSLECDPLKIAVETAVKAGADLTCANLRGADLTGADLTGANLRGADLTGADLTGANLNSANLNRANLCGAYLNRANLTGAYLNRADLNRADLRGADLSGADLCDADLCDADLRGAKIRNKLTIEKAPLQITGAKWRITIWDEHMQIGCEFHSLADWFSFDDHRILEMDGKTALKFWRNWKKPLQAICKAGGRK